MSTATDKRSLTSAIADAHDFRAMFSPDCYDGWYFAGSIRRKRPEVGDVEHVIIPAFGERPDPGNMFGGTIRVNLLWARLDELLASGHVTKHAYGETGTNRWGDLYRGVDFRGFNHELFCADAENFGAILAIRTGPADYSQQLVTRLKASNLYRQSGGKVIHVKSGQPVPVPTEESYFALCRVPYVPPEKRL